MANFIEVYDDGGRKQIVDEPIDMSMIMKLEAKPEDDFIYQYANGSRTRYFYRDYPESYETLVAVQPSTEAIGIDKFFSIKQQGVGNVGYHPHAPAKGITVEGSRVTFYYYTWLPQPVKTTIKFGLEVFNEAGEVSWASYNTSMNILDVLKEPDFRYAANIDNYFTKNYGHKDVAVILISEPYYQEGNKVYHVAYSFNSAGALRVYRSVHHTLSGDEMDSGWNDTIGYRLELLVVDVRNAKYMNQ